MSAEMTYAVVSARRRLPALLRRARAASASRGESRVDDEDAAAQRCASSASRLRVCGFLRNSSTKSEKSAGRNRRPRCSKSSSDELRPATCRRRLLAFATSDVSLARSAGTRHRQILHHQVLARQLVVVRKVVDELLVVQADVVLRVEDHLDAQTRCSRDAAFQSSSGAPPASLGARSVDQHRFGRGRRPAAPRGLEGRYRRHSGKTTATGAGCDRRRGVRGAGLRREGGSSPGTPPRCDGIISETRQIHRGGRVRRLRSVERWRRQRARVRRQAAIGRCSAQAVVRPGASSAPARRLVAEGGLRERHSRRSDASGSRGEHARTHFPARPERERSDCRYTPR